MWNLFKTLTTEQKLFPAVYGNDLVSVLKAINKLDEIEHGDAFCSICKSLVTIHNLQIIVPTKTGGFNWICNNPACVESLKTIETG